MNKLLKAIMTGLSLGFTIFTLLGVLFDIINDGTSVFESWSFTKMAIGTIIVSLGFSIPSLIYERENLARSLQILIHMGIGCTIMLLTAFYVGWIPSSLGITEILFFCLIEILIAFTIWFGFSLYYKKEAQKMNEQLHKLNL